MTHPFSTSPTLTAAAIAATRRRRLHRLGGAVMALFALMHLGNHLTALAGVAAHQQVLEALRLVYRHPLVEPVLLLVLAGQLASGTAGAWRLLRTGGHSRALLPVARLQAVSGLVLGGFVLVHVGAVLVGRTVLQLDTNFQFAAAGLHTPWAWFFAPYYGLGVAALGVHLACAAQRHRPPQPGVWRRALPWLLGLGGVVLGALLVALMAGWLVPVDIPARYLSTYPV
ncbi:MAG: hypothetical protein EP308_09170 [Burkholderiales bacterium]|nr:MAG: hypothetical protein EP308_09170 [Burkholderiales bacterium]